MDYTELSEVYKRAIRVATILDDASHPRKLRAYGTPNARASEATAA